MKKLSVFLVMFMLSFGPMVQMNINPAYAGGGGGGGGLPFCSDFVDNDGDGKTDDADPNCHTDGDALNVASYDPLGASEGLLFLLPVCSDFLDNDSDGLIDDMDPACHTDRDASNAASYDPLITSENDPAATGGSPVGGGGSPIPSPTPTPTPTPIIEAPKGEVLGAETVAQTCGGTTGRPCLLQKTGGIPFNRITENNKAVKLAKLEKNSISISKIKLNTQVLQMTDIRALRNQTWILPWTSTPDKGGNTVIVGHTYNLVKGKYSKNVFWDLETLEKGDTIDLTWKGKKYTYIITEKGTAKPEDWQLENQTEKAMLTIYGCGRKDNTYRNYIKAELVEEKTS